MREKIIFGVLFFAFSLCIFLYRVHYIKNEFQEIHNKFMLIAKIDSLNNYVSKKNSFKNIRYSSFTTFLTLDDGSLCKISANSNSIYSDKGVNDIISEGD